MINFSEEIAYWYLRLNGFFPISNFVIHKTDINKHTSDADVLGIRTPFVFEEIGGQKCDWDDHFIAKFESGSIIGIICQVKGGATGTTEKLFSEEYLLRSVKRLGLTKDINPVMKTLRMETIYECESKIPGNLSKFSIAKLLISRDIPSANNNYIHLSLDHVIKFIIERIQKYKQQKYADRGFFSSMALQTLIEYLKYKDKNPNSK